MCAYRQRGTVLTDHTFTVPLDHSQPGGERIEVFAREVVAAGQAGSSLPWLLFLQGGPGFGAPRPSGRRTGPAGAHRRPGLERAWAELGRLFPRQLPVDRARRILAGAWWSVRGSFH